MESKLYWLVNNQVLYWKLSGAISASAISEMSRFIITTIDRQNIPKVHLILDATGVKSLKHANREARSEFALLAKQVWMGQVVAIVHNVQIQIHLNAMSSAFGMKWKTVPSMKHANRSLQQSDPMLRRMPELRLDSIIINPIAELT